MQFYLPKYFDLQELVDPVTYSKLGSQAWRLFDPRLLWTADQLRERFGPMVVNTWRNNGRFRFRGFRPSDCFEGAFYSQHKLGRALDCHFVNCTVEEARADILNVFSDAEAYQHITCVEVDVSWLHFDVRNYDRDKNGLLKITRS